MLFQFWEGDCSATEPLKVLGIVLTFLNLSQEKARLSALGHL